LTSKTEAAATVRVKQLRQNKARQEKLNQLLSIPATLDVQDVQPDGSSVRFRRVVTPPLQPQVTPQPVANPVAQSPRASIAAQRKATAVTLTITSADDGDSLFGLAAKQTELAD